MNATPKVANDNSVPVGGSEVGKKTVPKTTRSRGAVNEEVVVLDGGAHEAGKAHAPYCPTGMRYGHRKTFQTSPRAETLSLQERFSLTITGGLNSLPGSADASCRSPIVAGCLLTSSGRQESTSADSDAGAAASRPS
jgi:hypothetical protein